jgi:23S rRNA pseudouridine1911/1915/1917 synthase
VDYTKLQVIYEDNHLIAVNKPAGMLVHADETGDDTMADLVKWYIKERYNKPGDVFLGVIHRLDRPVSGLTIFARTTKALQRMNEMFQKREVKKTYFALTENRPEELEGDLVHFLVKDHDANITKASTTKKGPFKEGKEASLHYAYKGSIGVQHLIEVQPHTGRPHQIRVQLSKMGCPIRGDVKYGGQRKNQGNFIHLHARKLEFIHPVKLEPVTIIADLPREPLWQEFIPLISEF